VNADLRGDVNSASSTSANSRSGSLQRGGASRGDLKQGERHLGDDELRPGGSDVSVRGGDIAFGDGEEVSPFN
jgi:hypothetical protein